MKKVLLSTTALVFAAGVASADGHMSMSGSAEIVYGNFGTGDFRSTGAPGANAGPRTWSAGTDVDISMSGGNGDVSYSATLELDETGAAMGPISLSMGGATVTYDANGLDDLTVAGADGEDDNVADVKVAYAMGALSASIAVDNDTDDSVTVFGYSADGVTASMTMTDQAGATSNEIDVTYAMGAVTVGFGTDDDSNWDASVDYDLGNGTTVGLATDSDEVNTLSASTSVGDISLTLSQEFGTGEATALTASYDAGAISFSVSSDTGQAGKYGDEAETVLSVGYDLGGGAALEAKANDQDEMEVKLSFSF